MQSVATAGCVNRERGRTEQHLASKESGRIILHLLAQILGGCRLEFPILVAREYCCRWLDLGDIGL